MTEIEKFLELHGLAVFAGRLFITLTRLGGEKLFTSTDKDNLLKAGNFFIRAKDGDGVFRSEYLVPNSTTAAKNRAIIAKSLPTHDDMVVFIDKSIETIQAIIDATHLIRVDTKQLKLFFRNLMIQTTSAISCLLSGGA